MDAIALLVGAGYALMAGAVGAAAVFGSPRAKDRAHDREQAERQRQIDELEQLLHDKQFTTGRRPRGTGLEERGSRGTGATFSHPTNPQKGPASIPDN